MIKLNIKPILKYRVMKKLKTLNSRLKKYTYQYKCNDMVT